MKRLLLLTIAVLAGAAMHNTATASPPPTAVHEGIVDEVDTRYDAVIISDRQFAMDSTVPVHRAGGAVSRSSLSKGMNVRFTATVGEKPLITEMWIEP